MMTGLRGEIRKNNTYERHAYLELCNKLTVVLRVRMLNTTSVIDSRSNGLVYSRPSVNFSLSVYVFSYTVLLISLMTTTLNFFHTFNILQKKQIDFETENQI